jgi:hypothetical protein
VGVAVEVSTRTTAVDEILACHNDTSQLRVIRVDARVDHRDQHATAVGSIPDPSRIEHLLRPRKLTDDRAGQVSVPARSRWRAGRCGKDSAGQAHAA